MMDDQDVPGVANVPFADTEAGRQIFLLAGHAHQYGDAAAVEDDFKGFLHHDGVIQVDAIGRFLMNALDRPSEA